MRFAKLMLAVELLLYRNDRRLSLGSNLLNLPRSVLIAATNVREFLHHRQRFPVITITQQQDPVHEFRGQIDR
jgi:hypothetical protein